LFSLASDLELEKQKLVDEKTQLQSQLDDQRQKIFSLQQEKQAMILEMEAEQRRTKYNFEDQQRAHKHEMDELRREFKGEVDQLKSEHREALEAMERHHRAELADEQTHRSRELQELRTRLGAEQQDLNLELLKKEREVQEMRSQVEALKSDLDREQTLKGTLQQQITEMAATNTALEDRMRGLRAKIDFLESGNKQQSDAFASMEARLQEALRVAEEAREKLIKEETERRVLFNKYQELKGNIRVMCRVRPILDPSEGEAAKVAFPDTKTSSQIEVTGPEEKSSLGVISRKVLPFEFDRVFDPSVHNEEVFGEISQLVQSALDGYNVCIFCYGQTGSGKTYTMSSEDGMIPRATHMIYDTITKLQEKSWTYTMEGSFVEVYNEELNDLLTPGRESDPKKRLEIRHDEARKQTTVLNCKTVALDSPDKVEAMLKQAQSNRSVAATKANERSSRSHSVFILKLVGENSATNERCEGTLNLVDLAGSERLKHSQAEGERMKETQNINKSLACLGDVIEALGRGSGHVPYRNSKLTHLLQYSLGGNSKTLMFVMVSPLEAHLKETITSLRFATKVCTPFEVLLTVCAWDWADEVCVGA
jgi:kinesin family protein C1